jgi:RNA polymerase sigma-70 factor (ECF subfamily)
MGQVLPPLACMTKHEEQVTRAFEHSRDDVYRYLLTLGLRPPQAQEATQEVFMRLFVALEKGDLIQNERAWIFRVAHNLGIDLHSRERTQPLDAGLEAVLHDTSQGVEMNLIEEQRSSLIRETWKTLSQQQQQCLHLRAEGLKYREIAEAMGISISSVREFLSRAILRLQKAVYE